jgi:DNA processing protein
MLAPGIGHGLIARCRQGLGSAAAACAATAAALAGVPGISPDKAAALRRFLDDGQADRALQEELELMHRHGVQVILRDDPGYPSLLATIPDAPVMLYVRGQIQQRDALGLGIVGSRRCTHYGREQADRFAFQLAQSGLTIVSGGAYGIDAAAHKAALRAQGRTLAVIGSGLANPYPADHAALFDEVVQSNAGAIISELPMRTAPMAENFPRRNRIISGLSLAVLVIEAAKRSGALITARLCVEEHGRECLALPGRVDAPQSEGCHHIIREGWATLVTKPAEVLDALGDTGQLLQAGQEQSGPCPPSSQAPSLFESTGTDVQRQLLEAMQSPRSLDQLVAWTKLNVEQVQRELTMLEVRGLIRRAGGLFARRSRDGM